MPKLVGCAAVCMSLTVLGLGAVAGQDKGDTKSKDKDKVAKQETTADDYQNLATLKDVTGKIASVDVTAGTMTLTIEWSYMEPNKNFNAAGANQKLTQQQQQVQNDYDQIMRAKNPVQRQQAMSRLQTHLQQLQNSAANMQNMFKVAKSSKDFDLEVMDPVKVARAKLPVQYDSEGEVVKYTDEQLKKMKSADISSAYTAAPEDLKVGQQVKLYLNPPKEDKKKSDPAGDKKTDAGGDAQDSKDKTAPATPPAALTRVRMVLILEEASPPDPDDSAKKKKKKDN
jgi:hypothetical protein